MAATLHPVHKSLVRHKRVPAGFAAIELPDEQAAVLEKIAIETFTMASNAGVPFTKALLALLLTGMDFGINAKAGKDEL
jgi:hypothetical protein